MRASHPVLLPTAVLLAAALCHAHVMPQGYAAYHQQPYTSSLYDGTRMHFDSVHSNAAWAFGSPLMRATPQAVQTGGSPMMAYGAPASPYSAGAIARSVPYARSVGALQPQAGSPHMKFGIPNVVDPFGLIWGRAQAVSPWSPFVDWGGSGTAQPVVVTKGGPDGEGLDAFIVGADGHVYYRSEHGGVMSEWVDLGGNCFPGEQPAVAAARDGVLTVVVRYRGSKNIYINLLEAGTWTGFQKVGRQQAKYGPGVALWFTRGLFIFVTGMDDRIYKLERRHDKYWQGRNSWIAIGDEKWAGPPVGAYITQKKSHDVYVFAYNAQSQLHYSHFRIEGVEYDLTDRVGGWVDAGMSGDVYTRPTTYAREVGFEIALRKTDGNIAYGSFNLGDMVPAWTSLEFKTPGRPAVVSNQLGYMYLFALGFDQTLFSCGRAGADQPLSAWERVGEASWTSNPTAIIRKTERIIDVFVLGDEGSLHHSQKSFPN